MQPTKLALVNTDPKLSDSYFDLFGIYHIHLIYHRTLLGNTNQLADLVRFIIKHSISNKKNKHNHTTLWLTVNINSKIQFR